VSDSRMRRLAVALAGALLLALAPFAPVVGQEVSETGDPETTQETTLTGQLSTDEMGGYVLIEGESGDSVKLQGPEDLADHVGSNVVVTGTWEEDDEGVRYLQVTLVEPAA